MFTSDKRIMRAVKRIAKVVLAEYRKQRRFGKTPTIARSIAHFVASCGKRGAANMLAQNRFRKYAERIG